MKLKEYIQSYREEHDLSQRKLADICGLSNGYISMLESGINPNTQLPLIPSMPKLKLLANGMGLTLNELLMKVDDMPIDLQADDGRNAIGPDVLPLPANEGNSDSKETHLVQLYRELNAEGQEKLIDYADDLVSSGKYIKK